MLEKRFIALFLVTTLVPMFGFMVKPAKEEGVKKVVIDAGHGGKDPGNLGTGRYKSREKDISLDVALLLGQYIKEYLPDVQVVYTRDDDSFPELWKRTTMANKEEADLFISIHCNAFHKSSVKGCESFVLGFDDQDRSLATAKKENSVIFLEENYEEKYVGFDPNKPETLIGLGLFQGGYIDQSVLFAKKIQAQFRDRVNRIDRGVKQKPLWVISQVFMPSVLVELGFLTNHAEEDFLNSEEGKEYMASAIFRAFRDYKREIEADLGVLKPEEAEMEIPQEIQDNLNIPKEDHVHKEDEAVAEENQDEVKPVPVEKEDEVFFTVQLVASREKLSPDDELFNKLAGEVTFFEEGGWFKYTYGKAKSYDEALALKGQGKFAGFEDCYLIAFKGKSKISVNEAKRLLR